VPTPSTRYLLGVAAVSGISASFTAVAVTLTGAPASWAPLAATLLSLAVYRATAGGCAGRARRRGDRPPGWR